MEAPLRFVRKQRDLNKIGRTVGLNLDFSPFCYTLIYGWTEATKVVLVKAGGYGFGILGSWMVLITVWITEVVLVVGETVRSKLLGLEF